MFELYVQNLILNTSFLYVLNTKKFIANGLNRDC